jgi:putative membrane protein
MNNFNNNDWLFGWGWLIWIGFVFLMFSSFGSWGYTYRAHRRVDNLANNSALAILNERYARGELTREQFLLLKSDLIST